MSALMGLCVVLQLLDVATTWHVIRRGIGREVNPLLIAVMARVGVLPALLLTKLALFAACWWLRPPWPAYAILAAIYTAVLINNAKAIHQGRQNRL
ncbi:DUF5658 family protein [Chromobacterium violaceum]|uniref:DUF5658 domain-containing protein n=1 Tax=Chromobacterium violaceum TaxID=536 RepID=A0A202BD40_CHRVL|nr:DUF5658 family protein [Chromobacterium violaceum]OVE49466.1 hypothetical protein CBW21_06170 [Chromobacterium violaceum]